MRIGIAGAILCLFLFYGCSKDNAAEGVTTIGVDFVWDLKHLKRSPEVHLDNVPDGVEHIEVLFFDATASDFEHGGGSLSYDGSGIIPAGAFNDFKGLTNLWGIPKFKVTVAAFDKSGRLVGKGTITKKPPDQ